MNNWLQTEKAWMTIAPGSAPPQEKKSDRCNWLWESARENTEQTEITEQTEVLKPFSSLFPSVP
jgi:hypothetical protein